MKDSDLNQLIEEAKQAGLIVLYVYIEKKGNDYVVSPKPTKKTVCTYPLMLDPKQLENGV